MRIPWTVLALMSLAPGAVAAQAPAQSDTAAAIAAGKKIFTGKGMCFACHGSNAKGTPLAPDLTDTTWINIDGTLPAIAALVRTGVPRPVHAPAPMPPMGGARLSGAEIDAVSLYVRSLSRSK